MTYDAKYFIDALEQLDPKEPIDPLFSGDEYYSLRRIFADHLISPRLADAGWGGQLRILAALREIEKQET